MLAGIGVIASDTAGQREVLGSWIQPQQLVKYNDPQALAHAIDQL